MVDIDVVHAHGLALLVHVVVLIHVGLVAVGGSPEPLDVAAVDVPDAPQPVSGRLAGLADVVGLEDLMPHVLQLPDHGLAVGGHVPACGDGRGEGIPE